MPDDFEFTISSSQVLFLFCVVQFFSANATCFKMLSTGYFLFFSGDHVKVFFCEHFDAFILWISYNTTALTELKTVP